MVRIKRILSLRLNNKQEQLLADKLFDFASFFAVGFVITRLIGESKDFHFAISGFFIYTVLVVFSVWLRR